MDIYRAGEPIATTNRIEKMQHQRLITIENSAGAIAVATDPVGARPGNYVFTVTGTAARWAMGDYDIPTDLAICGIIDHWEDEEREAAGAPAGAPVSEKREF